MTYFKDRIAQAQEAANFAAQGIRHAVTSDFRGISSPDLAQLVAARELKVNSYPIARFHLKMKRIGYQFKLGGVFALTFKPDERRGFTRMAVRVTNINYGNLTDGVVEMDVVEDIFAVAATGYASPQDTGWEEPAQDPNVPAAQMAIEAPYFLINSEERRILVGIVRGDNVSIGFQAFADETNSDTPSFYNEFDGFMPGALLNADYTRKSDALDATGFVLKTDHDLAFVESVDDAAMRRGDGLGLFVTTGEFFGWTTILDNGDGTFNLSGILRGALDTIPVDHLENEPVILFQPGTFSSLRDKPYTVDLGPVEVWLVPRSQSGVLTPDDVTPVLVTTSSRAQDPYPPGNVRVNAMPWPASTVGTANLTLAHRHRLTDLDLVQQDAGDTTATPEGDYSVHVLIDSVDVRDLSSGHDTSYDYTTLDRVADGDGDGRKTVQFQITPTNGALEGTVRLTDAFQMTGLGMCLGDFLGGKNG